MFSIVGKRVKMLPMYKQSETLWEMSQETITQNHKIKELPKTNQSSADILNWLQFKKLKKKNFFSISFGWGSRLRFNKEKNANLVSVFMNP